MGSKEAIINILDDETCQVTEKLMPVDGDRAGHSNTVFSVNYLNEHQIISGGWDDHVHLWDVRS